MEPIRTVIVDDVEEIRALVHLQLRRDGRFTVVGEAANGSEAVKIIGLRQPGIVVLDLHMPVMDGLEALPLIRHVAPATKIVVLSAFPDPYTLLDVLAQGADTCLDKATAMHDLVPTMVNLMWPANVGAAAD